VSGTDEPLHLAAPGASTALGRCAWSSAAAVRAAVSLFAEHPLALDTEGVPVRLAAAGWLDPELEGSARFEALLLPAIAQSLTALEIPAARLALALALPEPRPGVPELLSKDLLKAVAREFPDRFGVTATFANGHAAGFAALEAARRKLVRNELDACVVAGVDSYNTIEALEWLEDRDQLHGAGPMNNAWGLIPGEAAGTIVLLRASALERNGLEPLGMLLGIGTGVEPNPNMSDRVCLGEGLTKALDAALAHRPGDRRVTDIYCDMNGEPFRGDEYGFATLRVGEAFEDASGFVAPADCWGDVGAAGAPLHLGLACIAAFKHYARGSLALAWASSESGARAAALIGTRAG
jgi:3-oxoacyl-[acyl-carrier-protein] synthase-1